MKSLIIRLAATITGVMAWTYHPGAALNDHQYFSVVKSQEVAPDMMAMNPNVHEIIQSNTIFALDLYRQLSESQNNIFFSPYSLSNSLAMTYAGSAGETAKQMAKVLHFNLSADAIHPAFSQLADLIHAESAPGYRMQMANRLWGQQNYGFLEDFLTLTQDYYGAGLQEVDFANKPEATRQVINQWVSEETQDTIANLIPEGSLTPTTRLVLTNAIYFQGNWLLPFQPENTKPELFTVLSGEEISVPMMYQKTNFGMES
jgi:serpin B